MLRSLADGIWEVNHPHKLLRLFPLGHRMTVLRQASGELVLHSPIPLDEALREALENLGNVAHVLAPSIMHNLFLTPYDQQYPDARFWAVPKFASKYPKLRADAILDESTQLTGLRFAQIAGMPKVNECVVLHESSGSLIVADLVFHFPRSDSFALRTLLKANSAYGKVAASRLFRSFIKDRDAMRASLDRVLDWDFDRLIVGHGEIVEKDAKASLRAAYSWLS